MSLKIRLPRYETPRLKWRKLIYANLIEAVGKRKILYSKHDRLQLDIVLYFKNPAITFHDVDNRLKDIMDALQGRIGGSKKIRKYKPIVPNDSQIYRVVVEKKISPKQGHEMGHLVIKKYP